MAEEPKKTKWWMIAVAGFLTGTVVSLLWIFKDRIMPAPAPASNAPAEEPPLSDTGNVYAVKNKLEKGYGACQCTDGHNCISSPNGTCECCGLKKKPRVATNKLVASKVLWVA